MSEFNLDPYVNEVAAQHYRDLTDHMTQPSVLYRPGLSIDGNQWCALYGEDLQSGIAGLGDTPEMAMRDFNRNWHNFKPANKEPAKVRAIPADIAAIAIELSKGKSPEQVKREVDEAIASFSKGRAQ
jgi:hypothetical protein